MNYNTRYTSDHNIVGTSTINRVQCNCPLSIVNVSQTAACRKYKTRNRRITYNLHPIIASVTQIQTIDTLFQRNSGLQCCHFTFFINLYGGLFEPSFFLG
uniref:Uncharacterized protein n=1 Tax=Cacopsylla melanoneura TaxID=428564 RepID=A0A8D8RF71_9HEMI